MKKFLGVTLAFGFIFLLGLLGQSNLLFATTPTIPRIGIENELPATVNTTVETTPADSDYFYPPVEPIPSQPPGIYELVQFDKRGEAQVAVKIIFDPEENELLKDFTFTIPGEKVTLVRVVHERTRLVNRCYPPLLYKRPLPAAAEMPAYDGVEPSPGIAYPEYCPPSTTVFTTLNPTTQNTKDGLKVTVSASPNLTDGQQESLLIYYRTNDYTSGLLTNYQYTIKTVRVPFTSSTSQVGIVTKGDLRLKDEPGYNPGGYNPNFRALEKARALKDQQNQELAAFSNEIMYYGALRKVDSDIPANTSFEINGVYGPHWLLLYVKEVFWGVTILTLVMVGVFFLTRKLAARFPASRTVIIVTIISLTSMLILNMLFFSLYLFLRSKALISF